MKCESTFSALCRRCKKQKSGHQIKLVDLHSGTPEFLCGECFYNDRITRHTKPGWIYVIGSGEFWKVGQTTLHPSIRLNQMQTGNPHTLELLMCWMVQDKVIGEKIAHRKLISLHYRSEWFKGSATQIKELLQKDFQVTT